MTLIDECKKKAGTSEMELQLCVQDVLEKEVLSYLSSKGVANNLVFQGGSSLKIVYGSPRYSVDLDFVKAPQGNEDLKNLCGGLDRFLKERYHDFNFELKTQKDTSEIQRMILNIQHPLLMRSMKIPIEKFNVPAYTRKRYREGSLDLSVETPDELMADKLVALMLRKYVKPGDVYDLNYLSEKGAKPDIRLIQAKFKDYGGELSRNTVQSAIERLEKVKGNLPKMLRGYFASEDWKEIESNLDVMVDRVIEILKSVEMRLLLKGRDET